MDTYKFCELVESELDSIRNKGITSSNIDNAYKLVDMLKDLKNIEYWDNKMSGYSERRYSYGDNNRYDRDSSYNDYMTSKRSYRYSRSPDGKDKMMSSLDKYMNDITEQIEDLARDADTPEEREKMHSYARKIQNVLTR